jgi:hypothetical protein
MDGIDFFAKAAPIAISFLAVVISTFSFLSANKQRRGDVYFDTVSQLYNRQR